MGDDVGQVLTLDGTAAARLGHRSEPAAVRTITNMQGLWDVASRSRLTLHYQPIVDCATGSPRAVEGLLRRRSRWGGPATSAGSSAHLLEWLGPWVADRAARDAGRWAGRGVTTYVNMAPVHLADPGFVDTFLRAQSDVGLLPGDIAIEITEVAPVTSEAAATIRRLHERGVPFVLDDFGVDNATLLALRDLPVDVVKLSAMLTRGLCAGSAEHTFVRALVTMAHDLGLTVVAEGIETVREFDAVTRAGCDLVQGYLFHRDLPASEIVGLLAPAPVGGRNDLVLDVRYLPNHATAVTPRPRHLAAIPQPALAIA